MSTFSQLQTDIKNYMEDDGTEFSTSLTQFISNTELKLSRDLSTPEFKRKVTSAFTANDPFLTMPTDLVTLDHFQVILPSRILGYNILLELNVQGSSWGKFCSFIF